MVTVFRGDGSFQGVYYKFLSPAKTSKCSQKRSNSWTWGGGRALCSRLAITLLSRAHSVLHSLRWIFAVSENKALCHPSSVDSLSTSAATEDHVSMGGWAARKALRVIEHVEQGKIKMLISRQTLRMQLGEDISAILFRSILRKKELMHLKELSKKYYIKCIILQAFGSF